MAEKSFRRKEATLKKSEAVLQQRIQLLEMQLQETEEREANQRQMYDKLFEALDEGSKSGLETPTQSMRRDSTSLHHSSSKELGSTTGSLFGAKAVENMQKRYTDQLQARANELEEKVSEKDQMIEQL